MNIRIYVYNVRKIFLFHLMIFASQLHIIEKVILYWHAYYIHRFLYFYHTLPFIFLFLHKKKAQEWQVSRSEGLYSSGEGSRVQPLAMAPHHPAQSPCGVFHSPVSRCSCFHKEKHSKCTWPIYWSKYFTEWEEH